MAVLSLEEAFSRKDESLDLLMKFNEIPNCKVLEAHIFAYAEFAYATNGIIKFTPESMHGLPLNYDTYEVIITPPHSFGMDIKIENLKYRGKYENKNLMTYSFNIFSKLAKLNGVKMLSVMGFAQGNIGLYGFNNNVYQIIIRQTAMIGKSYPFGQFKQLFGNVLKKKGASEYGVRLKDIDISSLFKK